MKIIYTLTFVGLILELISWSFQPAGFSPLMIPLILIWLFLRSLILVGAVYIIFLMLNYFKLWGQNLFTLLVLASGIVLFYYGNSEAHSIYFENEDNAELANNYLYYIGYPGSFLILLAINFAIKNNRTGLKPIPSD